VCHLARRIDEQAPQGRPVGILLPHGRLFPVAALACLATGRPYVPIGLSSPAARIHDIVHEADLAAMIVGAGEEAGVTLPASLPRIALDVAAPEQDMPPAFEAAAAVEAPAVILYTSGSTGKPKGICNDQRSLLQRVAEYTNSCHVHAADHFILLVSAGTIAGVREMLTALLNGAVLHMCDPHERGIHGVLETLRMKRITIGYMVPALLRALLRAPGAQEAFSTLRVARIGGDITLESDLDLFRAVAPASCHFFASFSATEMPAAFQWFVPPAWHTDGLRLPVGYPRPGIDCLVVDEDGTPVPAGEAGELMVRSRYLALGYWQDGHLQPGPFVVDADDPSRRILRSGDMVCQRPDGLWELIGRRDRQLKIRGQRADPGEVEALLRRCPDVDDAAVIARRNGTEATALVAYVVPGAAAEAGLPDQLRKQLAAQVPPHMRPAAIHAIPAIPQLSGFKPDMAALERLDRLQWERELLPASSDAGSAAPGPESARAAKVRDTVRQVWTSILGLRSFQADLRWDQTGGDSLKAIQIWFQIEERLGCKLPPLDVLDDSATPNRLMAVIEQHLSRRGAADTATESAAPLVFLMPGIAGDEPLLARFRAACASGARFRTLEYPEWRQTMEAGAGFAAIVDAVFAQICAEPACECYRLAGYSFGGFVAYEAARLLAASGRKVCFLGLLDSRRWDMARLSQRYRALLADPGRIPVALLRLMLALFVRRQWFVPLGAMAQVAMARPTAFSFTFHQHLNDKLRLGALRQWKLAPLDVPTTLFLSDDRLSGAPYDYGWGALCNSLSVVHIGGTHASMMEPPLRDELCVRFIEAL
jgi:acyl-coenzyme A synthetase/AMP-(fatty) acid ligase/thioesterase domain-containing protein/acyl carrier protein